MHSSKARHQLGHDDIQSSDTRHNAMCFVFYLVLVCVTISYCSAGCHYYVCHFAECHLAESHSYMCYSDYYYAVCCSVKCQSAEFHSSECHSNRLYSAKCHSAVINFAQ